MNYKCPHCGASEAAKILYGMPEFSAELETSMKNGEVFIGGCCISGEMPKYKCRTCGFEYGRPGGDPEQTDFEIASDMYELYQPAYVTIEEAAAALKAREVERLFFEYEGKPYVIDCSDDYCIQVPVIDFNEIGWRGSKTIAGPFKTFDELASATTIKGKSLADIADEIPNGFYEGW